MLSGHRLAVARRLAHLLVAQAGHVGVVHLHVAAAGVVKAAQLFAASLGRVVVEERCEFGILFAADAGAPATKSQCGV